MDSDNFVKMMTSGLLDFQRHGVLCDTTLRGQDGEIPAHSIVLAATSAKLKRELIRTDSEPCTQHIIELPDFSASDICCLLEYIYTGIPPTASVLDPSGIEVLCETLEIPQPTSWLMPDKVSGGGGDGDVLHETVHTIQDLIGSVFVDESSDSTGNGAAMNQYEAVKLMANDLEHSDNDLEGVQQASNAEGGPSVVNKIYVCETCKREFKRLAALRLHEKTHWATSEDALKNKDSKDTPKKRGRPRKIVQDVVGSLNDTVHVVEDAASRQKSVSSPDVHQFTNNANILRHLELIEVKKEMVENEISSSVVSSPKPRLCDVCGKVFSTNAERNLHYRTEHSRSDGLMYVCDCCHRAFQYASQLITHRHSHVEVTCDYCGEIFSSYVALYRHRFVHRQVKSEAGEWLFSCRVCAKQFSSKADVRAHRLSEHMQCNRCGRFFLKPCKLRRHEITCSRQRDRQLTVGGGSAAAADGDGKKDNDSSSDGFLCGECGKIFSRRTSLISHKKAHVAGDYYENIYASAHHTCDTCGRAFLKLARLKQHEIGCQLRSARKMAIANSSSTLSSSEKVENATAAAAGANSVTNGEFTCTDCGRVFDKQTSLSSHKKVHAPDEFRCATCGKVFTKRYYLINHELCHSDRRPHSCSHCGKAFKQLSQMLKHVQRRHVLGPRPHMCSECGRTFAVKSDLKDHEGIHTGLKVHMCDQCGLQFRTRGILRVHLRQHTGARPFQCSFCGRRFAQLSNKLKHETIHTGVCPVKCDTCGRGFPDTSALKRHELFHTGLRPHVCPTCGRTFALKTTLNAHVQIHESVRQHVCPVCNKAFVLRGGLLRHLKIHTRRSMQVGVSGGGASLTRFNASSSTSKLTHRKVPAEQTVGDKTAEDTLQAADSGDEEVAYEPDVMHAMYIAENVVEVIPTVKME